MAKKQLSQKDTDLHGLHDLKKRFLQVYTKTLNITTACEAINIARKTFYNWKDSDQVFAEAFESTEEAMLDDLEAHAKNRAKESDTVLIFLLKTKGKKRGYIEKTETEHSGNLSVQWNEEKTYESPAQ